MNKCLFVCVKASLRKTNLFPHFKSGIKDSFMVKWAQEKVKFPGQNSVHLGGATLCDERPYTAGTFHSVHSISLKLRSDHW